MSGETPAASAESLPFCLEHLPDVRRFIAANTPLWRPLPASKQKLLVCVFPNPAALTAAGLMVQGICARENLEPIAFLFGSKEQQEISRAIFQSFGVRDFTGIGKDHRLGWWRRRGIRLRLEGLKLAAAFNLENALDDFVAHFKSDGIRIGDLLYDHFIRFEQNYQRWPENKAEWFRHVKEHLASFKRHLDFYREKDYRGILVCDPVYCFSETFFLRLAQKFRAKVWVTTGRFCREYQEPDDFEFDRYRFSTRTLDRSAFPEDWEAQGEAYLANRFAGNIQHFDVQNAFGMKHAYTRASFLEAVGISPADPRPIIFLMPHCFSDANHKCQGHLYRDFFSWYRATLRQLPENKEAIWIVRPHPSGSNYGEQGVAEKYFREVESENVRLAPKNLSTDIVLELAKAIITVNGTIGLEAASRGVIAVICAKAIYSGLGFTLEPKSREEYLRLLAALPGWAPLQPEQIRAARRAIFFCHVLSRPTSKGVTTRVLRPGSSPDILRETFNLAYAEMADGIESAGWKNDALWRAIQRMMRDRLPVATQPPE